MLNTPNVLWIDGPVGRLQTIFMPTDLPLRGVAVINHPNPTQGGTFTNKVIQTAAKALNTQGFHCYLPNLRGVGESDGEHDYGRGEVEDCLAVVAYAQAAHHDAKQLILSGFSFGGFVALTAANHHQPDALLLLAPAVGMYEDKGMPSPCPQQTLLIHGAEDEVVPFQNALSWASSQDIAVFAFPDTTHFFHGKLIMLRQYIEKLLPSYLTGEQ